MCKMSREEFSSLERCGLSENAEVITDFCLGCDDECSAWGEMVDALYALRDKQGYYNEEGEFIDFEVRRDTSAEDEAFNKSYERFYPYFIKNCVEK